MVRKIENTKGRLIDKLNKHGQLKYNLESRQNGKLLNIKELEAMCRFLQNKISRYHFNMLISLINGDESSRKLLTNKLKDFSI